MAAKFVLMRPKCKHVVHEVGLPSITCGNFDTITSDED